MTHPDPRALLVLLRETFSLSLPHAHQVLAAIRDHGADPIVEVARLDTRAFALNVRGGQDARARWNDGWARARAAGLQDPVHQEIRALARALSPSPSPVSATP